MDKKTIEQTLAEIDAALVRMGTSLDNMQAIYAVLDKHLDTDEQRAFVARTNKALKSLARVETESEAL